MPISRTRHGFSSAATSSAVSLIFLLAASPSALLAQRARAPKPAATPVTATAATSRDWPDSAWREIGPAIFGGRVDDIEAVVSDPRIIFVGTASGGVFRSLNNGVTWDPVFDEYGTALSIGDIAIAPSDPNVVWVGTGEPNNRQSSTWGDGVYRSLDGGTTWQHMGLKETQSIGRVVIDPRDPNTVFVAAVGHLFGPNEERGLYRTRDAGKTWQKVLGVDENTGVTDVAMAPDGHTLIAATYQRRRRTWGFVGGGPGSGLWRSIDGGDTWVRLTKGLPAGDMGRIAMDFSRSNPNIVYAIVESRDGGVFRSTDGGATWTRQNRLDPRPSYFSQIRVDPKNPDRVWVLGTDFYTSIDAGKTFTTDSIQIGVHPDHHALWIDPNNPEHMMLGNDGGVFFTYDGARQWDYIRNLPIGQFYDIAIDAREPYWIFGGTQDNGTFAFPSGTFSRGPLTDKQVVHIEYGDGFQVAADPTNPRLVYANSQNGRGYVVDLETFEERRITPVPADTGENYRFNWNTAILLSPNDPHTYYYGANRLLKTTDYGTTWQPISPDLTKNQKGRELSMGKAFPRDRNTLSRDDGVSAYGNITTIAESPRAAGTIYVGTDDGNVQMTTDGGAHWTNITPRFHLSTDPAPPVSKVVASNHDAKTAYVTFDAHADDDMKPYIFKTTDGGATWSSIVGDLPAGGPVKTLTEDPRNPNVLFAGTEFGLYWSFDGGRHWSFPGGSLPRVQVDRILVNERNNDLILGTHGRSVIILDDIRALEAGDPAAVAEDVQLFPLRDVTERHLARDQPPIGGRTFRAPNVPTGSLLTYVIKDQPGTSDDSAKAVKIQVVAADGSVVRDLAGAGTSGLHRVVWDLRTQFAYIPPPADSGFYGPVLAPYVLPGTYTVKLTANGKTVSQPVNVRTDPRAITTPEALVARHAMTVKIDSLDRAFADGRKALMAVDAEAKGLAALAKARHSTPAVDSLVKKVTTELAGLQRGFSPQYGAPMGNVFDLLSGLDVSSATPTVAEQRTLDAMTADIKESITKLNTLITTEMPRLRAALSQAAPKVVQPVKMAP